MYSKLRSTSLLKKKFEEILSNSQGIRFISTKEVIDREKKYAAHNYHPLPVALTKGEGNVR